MSTYTGDGKQLARRGFLKRSALMAAAAAVAAVPALAQEPQAPLPAPQEEKKEEPPRKEEPAPEKKVLRDKNGREYRVCDMCGANMYQEKNVWTCEQCGYSYEE